MKKLIKYFVMVFMILVVAVLLGLSVRGEAGNPTPEVILKDLRSEGKSFELSSERSRYGLAMSVIDNHSLEFTREIAALALPDLGTINGKYVSLFAPGVSYTAMPLYAWGKTINYAQVAAFATSAIFAFLNFLLILSIVKKMTGNAMAGFLAGLTYTFGTVAWVYSSTLYEHPYSVFLMLLAIRIILSKRNFLKNIFIGLLFGLSIFVEYPGGVFFVPIIIWLIGKHIDIQNTSEKLKLSFATSILWLGIGFGAGLIPSFLYNQGAYGNPLQLAGTVASIRSFEALDDKAPKVAKPKTAVGFFKSEKLPQGVDVLITSKDRGVLIFSPVIILGLLGLWSLRKEDPLAAWVLIGEVVVVLTLFSLWGDPWGGWSFGPRYLIPAMAILGIGLGVAIDKFRKNYIFAILFFSTFIYSVGVSLIGAFTTLQIPPSVDPISKGYPAYTYLHNLNLLEQGVTGSFVYNTYLKNVLTLHDLALYSFAVILIFSLFSYVSELK